MLDSQPRAPMISITAYTPAAGPLRRVCFATRPAAAAGQDHDLLERKELKIEGGGPLRRLEIVVVAASRPHFPWNRRRKPPGIEHIPPPTFTDRCRQMPGDENLRATFPRWDCTRAGAPDAALSSDDLCRRSQRSRPGGSPGGRGLKAGVMAGGAVAVQAAGGTVLRTMVPERRLFGAGEWPRVASWEGTERVTRGWTTRTCQTLVRKELLSIPTKKKAHSSEPAVVHAA